MFARDDQTARLLREATAAKDSGDMDTAIESLEKAVAAMYNSPVSYPIETWLRLPLYLQQAKRMDEALAIFHTLIAETEIRIQRNFGHLSKSKRKPFYHNELATIYDKMRLACKREKMLDEAERYADESKKHKQCFEKLRKSK